MVDQPSSQGHSPIGQWHLVRRTKPQNEDGLSLFLEPLADQRHRSNTRLASESFIKVQEMSLHPYLNLHYTLFEL